MRWKHRPLIVVNNTEEVMFCSAAGAQKSGIIQSSFAGVRVFSPISTPRVSPFGTLETYGAENVECSDRMLSDFSKSKIVSLAFCVGWAASETPNMRWTHRKSSDFCLASHRGLQAICGTDQICVQGPGKKWEHYPLNHNKKVIRLPMHVKKGDTVQVISGKDKGKVGEIEQVSQQVVPALSKGKTPFRT